MLGEGEEQAWHEGERERERKRMPGMSFLPTATATRPHTQGQGTQGRNATRLQYTRQNVFTQQCLSIFLPSSASWPLPLPACLPLQMPQCQWKPAFLSLSLSLQLFLSFLLLSSFLPLPLKSMGTIINGAIIQQHMLFLSSSSLSSDTTYTWGCNKAVTHTHIKKAYRLA